MGSVSLKAIEAFLVSEKAEDLRQGLDLARKGIAHGARGDARSILEAISTVFFIDPLDRPDLAPLLNEAIDLVVGFGDWVIPILVQNLDTSDLKAQIAIATALGRMGEEAIDPLTAEYRSTTDPARNAFLLFALGKIKSPEITKAVSLALEATRSPDRELRDTAIRAIGKFAESIPESILREEVRQALVTTLTKSLEEKGAGIRAKAVRSLGKFARFGHLTTEEREELRDRLEGLLGTEHSFSWDRAYIVRKEAKEALRYV